MKPSMAYEQGIGSQYTVSYLKDVSSILFLESAVREGVLDRHLEAERQTFNLILYDFLFLLYPYRQKSLDNIM